MKSVLELIDLHMQITDLPLYAFISINFNAVDECRPGALFYYNILVFLFDIKRLNILCVLEVVWGICACM